MILRMAPGNTDATIVMAIAVMRELREIEIFIYGLSIAREAIGRQGVRHLSKLTVSGERALDKLRQSECHYAGPSLGSCPSHESLERYATQHI